MRRPVAIVVRPRAGTSAVLGWLRRLLPAAVLVVSSVSVADVVAEEVLVLEDVDADSGPLAIADAIQRSLGVESP
jgi:hypothetical protein